MKNTTEQRFKVGDKVVDRGGFTGTIVKVTIWKDSLWYDVNLGRTGEAVRFDADLELAR